jgi:hypothetical protein
MRLPDESIIQPNPRNATVGGISDRAQEIKRRRQRRKKLVVLQRKLKKATVSERQAMADRLRKMTPGAEVIITNWNLIEQR